MSLDEYENFLKILLKIFVGAMLNVIVIQIFLPNYLAQPLLPVSVLDMSRALFIFLIFAGFSIVISGYFSFIFYIEGPYILYILLKRRRETHKLIESAHQNDGESR
jgi:hypothetical protein